jgi:hypothetical protein
MIDPVERVLALFPAAEMVGDEDQQSPIHLPDEFWTARPVFGHIRQAAHSRTRSAEVVFHCVLARVAGALPYTLKLPAVVGTSATLSYFSVSTGPPGSGKSSGAGVAAELVPVGDYVADQLPVGSGEGIAEVLFDLVSELDDATGKAVKVKRQVRHNAIVYIDEGDALTALGTKSGSTTLSTYRSIWSGQTIGQTNASTERKRIVPAGSYTFGLIVALQPALAGALLDDVVAGTPQRFAWAWATDPSIPDERPAWTGELVWRVPPVIHGGQEMAVDPAIAREIQSQDLAVMRGEIQLDSSEGHAMLLRLKVAGLLAIIDGRLNIDSEDWHLAGIVSDTSRAVRDHVQAIVAAEQREAEKATSNRLARRQVEASTAVDRNRLDDVARKVDVIVRGHRNEGITAGGITRGLSRRQREMFQEALSLAIDRGGIEQRSETGQGEDKRRYWPTDGPK